MIAEEGTSIVRRLAALNHSLKYEELPPETLQATKKLILDSIGVTIGGLTSKPAIAARRVAQRLGGNPSATIIGARTRTSPALAALANGTALRYLDYNDGYHGERDSAHPSGNLPVALAVAEQKNLPGRDLIAALVAAYEIHCRLADFAGEPNLKRRGWHNSTNLQFSAAALASRLLGNEPDITANAIAISGTHQNTLAQIQHGEIPSMKATNDGWIAKGGIEAALLAQEGVTGPDEVFEGRAGWVASVAARLEREALLAPFAPPFRIEKSRVKIYAAVGPAMSVVQAAIDLFRTGLATPEEIDEIAIQLPESIVKDPALGEDKRYPMSKETADHSYHFLALISLLEGACGPAQFEEEKLVLPWVRALLTKIRLEADPEFTALDKESRGGGMRLRLRDGTTLERRYPYPPGHARNPLEDQQIVSKFETLMMPTFTRPETQAILSAIDSLEEFKNISMFTRLLVSDRGEAGSN